MGPASTGTAVAEPPAAGGTPPGGPAGPGLPPPAAPAAPAPAAGGRAGAQVRRPLPLWPVAVAFAGYLGWWVLGVGDAVWGLVAIPMVAFLAAHRDVRVPRGFGLWLFFLGWMFISAIEIDTGGRMVGFLYRAVIYLGATVAFVYVYNTDRRTLTLDRIAGVMTCFWVSVVIGGFLALALPHAMIQTPASFLMPGSLLKNDLVHQIVMPRLTQGDPNGYFRLALRPSAPFSFTNAWGTNYTLTLPYVFILLARIRKGVRFWLLILLIPVSLVPAYMTQNRGMLLALGTGLLYVALRNLARGHVAGFFVVLAFLGAAAGVNSVVQVDRMIQQRVSVSDTNTTRLAVYTEAIERTLQSPLIGRGAPRPSRLGPAAPSVGTQGQLWMVLFSHGFVGAALFMGWFIGLALRTVRAPTGAELWLHTGVAMMCLESIYYGMVGSALVLTMVTGATALRERRAAVTS